MINLWRAKIKLVKTLLCTQLKQTNQENWLNISTESPKEGFNETVFQHFMDELKYCNLNMQMDFQLLVPVFYVFAFKIFGCCVTF